MVKAACCCAEPRVRYFETDGYRVYILGARQEVPHTATHCLHQRHPQLAIAGCHHGYFADHESPEIAAEIRAAQPDILFLAMSSPRKEQWLGRFGESLGVPLVMGVGGSIDIIAGITRRAPKLWQRLGIEWLYRLLQEPRRMFRRYLLALAQKSRDFIAVDLDPCKITAIQDGDSYIEDLPSVLLGATATCDGVSASRSTRPT
jgi:exopolysaccharide biosynthesis WecB/TagA/CpsF family protein